MTTDLNNIPKNFILSSPESLRKKILDRLVDYEELNGVDLSKTHFFSYMIDILSMLSSDNANTVSLSKKESYLVTANLPSSIYNWSSYLSYAKDFAKPAEVDVLLSIPLTFTESSTFKIDYFTSFKAGEITYSNSDEYFTFTYDKTTNVLSGKALSENAIRNLKVIVEDNVAHTTIPLKQLQKSEEEYYIPYDLQAYQPYSFTLQYIDRLANIEVFVRSDKNTQEEEWERAENYFDMGLGEKKYHFKYETNNTIRIMFGNDIFGRQPDPGSIVRIVLYYTKADKGSIIANSITKMDRILHVDTTGLAKIVTINVMNVLASSQGVADETLYETKTKAIARFRARQRTVSEGDFNDIKHIIPDGLPYSHAKAILKRSDIKTNEVVLYVVLPKEYRTYERQVIQDTGEGTKSMVQVIPVPTNSLTVTIPDSTTNIRPYHTYTDIDGTEYVCPFGFIKENDSSGFYYYITKNINVTPEVHIYDQLKYPLSFINLNLTGAPDFSIMTFQVKYYNLNNTVNVANLKAKLYLQFRTDLRGPYEADFDPATSTITHVVPMNDIESGKCSIEYHITDTTSTSVVAIIRSTDIIRKDLKTVIYSSISTMGGGSTVYDIPCILKSYYLSLSQNEQTKFETDILQKLVGTTTLTNFRMMNVSINIKFAKTLGNSANYYLNEPNKPDVLDILNTPPASPTPGSRYIVGRDPTGEWIGKSGKIALYVNGWVYLEGAPGDIVYVTNLSKKYTCSGNANMWFAPVFNIPYTIDVFVYINGLQDNDTIIISSVKKQLLYTLATISNLDSNQHRSLMYKAIQELGSHIDHCEIILPEVDIFFGYDINDFTKEQLKRYVPEFIYTDEDHIRVKIIRV